MSKNSRLIGLDKLREFDSSFDGSSFDGSLFFAKIDGCLQKMGVVRVGVLGDSIIVVEKEQLEKDIDEKFNYLLHAELKASSENISDDFEYYYDLMSPILKEYVKDGVYYINGYDFVFNRVESKLDKCLYCESKEKATHFKCGVCGDGMCGECYDVDKEHDHHYNEICQDNENEVYCQKLIEVGVGEVSYICEKCMGSLVFSVTEGIKSMKILSV